MQLFEAVDKLNTFTLNEAFDENAKKLVDYAKEKGYKPYNGVSYYQPEKVSMKNENGETYEGWELEVESGDDVLQLTLDGDNINVYNLVTGETVEGKPLSGSVVSSEYSMDLYDFTDFEKDSSEYKAGMKALDIDGLDSKPVADIASEIDNICNEYKADSVKVKSAVFSEIHRDDEYREYKNRSTYEK